MIPQWISTLTEDGKLYLVLDSESLHFEIEIYASGRADWFFRDRATDVFDGNDDDDFLPDRMAARYSEVVASIRGESGR